MAQVDLFDLFPEPAAPAPTPARPRERTWADALRQQIVHDEVALREGGWGPEEFFRQRIADYRAALSELER